MARKPAEAKAQKPTGKKTEKQSKPTKPEPKKPATVKKAPAHKKRKQPLTTAEWRKIRIEYVKGKTTYQKLAEKYGVAAGTIRKRASKEAWGNRKRKLDTKVEQKVLERVCDARAREFELIAAVNDRMDLVLDNLLEFIEAQPPKKYDDLRGVESLTKAIAQVVETKRDLYNVPSEVDKEKIKALREKQKVDRARYRLEKKKFDEEQKEKAASRTMAENTVIRVIVEGDEDGEALDE